MRPFLLMLVLFGTSTAAAPTFTVKIKVEDPSGVALRDQLVIVQDLNDREHEILRTLSDEAGHISALQLPAALYRIIATAPYGLWQTSVKEVLIGEQPTEITVKVQPIPTHGYGDVVTAE